jgi:hypothetical protein
MEAALFNLPFSFIMIWMGIHSPAMSKSCQVSPFKYAQVASVTMPILCIKSGVTSSHWPALFYSVGVDIFLELEMASVANFDPLCSSCDANGE